jgi:hypothetical protein
MYSKRSKDTTYTRDKKKQLEVRANKPLALHRSTPDLGSTLVRRSASYAFYSLSKRSHDVFVCTVRNYGIYP